MAFIQDGAKWYIADLVMEVRITGQRRNVVHVNTILVRADSPQQAHDEARRLGRAAAITYRNTQAKDVRVTFRGLRDLSVVRDELEHGAELFYREMVGVTRERLKALVKPKRGLSVFSARPRRTRPGPNYMPGSVAADLRAAGFHID